MLCKYLSLRNDLLFIGDSMGAILAYDALCRDIKRSSSEGSVNADADLNGRYRSLSGGESGASSPKTITSTDADGKCFYTLYEISSFRSGGVGVS